MRLSEAKFVVVDTETTGLPPEGRVVELALVEVGLDREPQIVYSALVDPGCPILPEASAVHHITDRDVAGKPRLSQIWSKVMRYIEDAILVAHNAEFDRGMLPETGRSWVCSKRLAQHLWPDAPRHSNQVLRYWLGIDVEVGQPHRALGDAIVTAHVFQRELRAYLEAGYPDDVEALIAFAESPIEMQTMPFGKHRGVPLRDVPLDYLDWALRNMQDLSPDLRWSIERVLERAWGRTG
ncbi:DNA polymerase III, epsilon subunit [Alicyclobacillus hesperidum URH17-3-68]|uniref:putative quorum-sensing-regulated virulence factor n=1 Tax=Alicyclobacillus hesperidum TaxID=89784 RepID=UPI000281C118|nr:DUF3820 family protein [Alicyclobacillus hesperidum]EJY56249.1 DNA polymerase III, epsilon subunit [Alicyclobacillus hesperidum URH17-3-68]